VTDFISRLAARATGGSAAASPRVPGLFEEPAAASDTTFEIVDQEVIAPARVGSTAEPARRADRPDELTQVEAFAQPPGAAVGGRRVALPAQRAPESAPGSPTGEPERAKASRRDARTPMESARGTRPTSTGGLPVTAALPAVAAAHETAATSPSGVSGTELPTVRVHIGRLEVRANVQAPVGQQPLRQPSHPVGLSLADYLRGKREAG
jgi:hypothetical protein